MTRRDVLIVAGMVLAAVLFAMAKTGEWPW